MSIGGALRVLSAAVLCLYVLARVPGTRACGQPSTSPSLAGSACSTSSPSAAVPHSWPWVGQLSLASDAPAGPRCGVSLLAPAWALTAKSCVAVLGCRPADFSVTFGEHDTGSGAETLHTTAVAQVVMHAGSAADVALLRLASAVPVGATASPVCLPPADAPVDASADAYVAKWNERPALTQAAYDILPNAECHTLWTTDPASRDHDEETSPGTASLLPLLGSSTTVAGLAALFALTTVSLNPNAGSEERPFDHADILCAGCAANVTRAASQDAAARCRADLGLPLVQARENGTFVQVGILSETGPFENCEDGPNAYVSVASYTAWINAQLPKPSTGDCSAVP